MKNLLLGILLAYSFAANAGEGDRFKVNNLKINTAHADMGPTYYNDQIVFASTRVRTTIVKRRWEQNQLPYFNLYVSDKDQAGELFEPKFFDRKLNRHYNEGPSTFSAASHLLVYTEQRYDSKDTLRLKLMTSYLSADGWGEPQEVPFNNAAYNVGHPSISKDGSTLYFASDMPGGFGGVDLYKVQRSPEGKWGEPVNLGKDINTAKNDVFPFVHEDGLLFFSSDGRGGKGGLDVFVTFLKATITTVDALEADINSEGDDFSFILSSDQKTGYFASNRAGGKGSDDIYNFTNALSFSASGALKGVVTDNDDNIVPDMQILLADLDGNIIGTTKTDANGAYNFGIEPDGKYKLTTKKEKYFPKTVSAEGGGDGVIVTKNIQVERDADISILGLVTEVESGIPIPGAKITLTDNMTGAIEVITADENGSFRRALEDKKLNERISYNLALQAPGYLAVTVTYNKALDKEGVYKIDVEAGLEMVKIMAGLLLEDLIDMEPIFFDLGKSNIRPDAAIELDKVVEVMNDNPSMEIELGSHSDCRGNNQSNLSLSIRRAEASADYIKARITYPERIVGKGYGETQLKNHCADGVTCSEEEHAVNRRTEFKIVKM